MTQYSINNLPSLLQKALDEKIAYIPTGGTVPLIANVAINEALALYTIVRHLQPTVSVEVGFAQGISTLAILQALADNGKGVHHVIDPFQANFGHAGTEMVRRAGLESYYEFHETFPENVIPNLPQVQFGFIDASHLFDLSLLEFVLVDKKLSPGGVLGFHDLWMPSLRSVISYVLNNRKYQIVRVDASSVKEQRYTLKQNLIKAISGTVGYLPKSEKLFRAEFLAYQLHLTLDNLTLMKKLEDDSRDWRFHRPF